MTVAGAVRLRLAQVAELDQIAELNESGSTPVVSSPGAAHLVGICGSGMKALAELLTGQGWQVSGSDLLPPVALAESFRRRGLRIHRGHHVDHLQEADVLVYSPAVDAENPERKEASLRGIPQFSYTEMLGKLMRGKTGVSIAGTHGKSTTTAMTACILEGAGLAPSAIIGAELRGEPRSGWAGDGEHFVVESCEYQRNFLNLSPRFAAILSIEPDHFDYFHSFAETIDAFGEFARRIPPNGLIVVPANAAAVQEACRNVAAEVQTFSLESEADWWAADLRTTKAGVRFRCFHRGEFFTEVQLQMSGRHNVQNALAAIALCHRAGAGRAGIREGLQDFAGIRRRFEPVGSWRGVTLIDDYAHHPTAILATLAAARERFGSRRLWCVFQPHQVSRTQALMTEFAASFAAADEVFVVPVYGAREQAGEPLAAAARELTERILAQGPRARFSPTLDQTVSSLEDEIQPGDVLITMGAGNIDQVHYAFTRRLQRHYPPR